MCWVRGKFAMDKRVWVRIKDGECQYKLPGKYRYKSEKTMRSAMLATLLMLANDGNVMSENRIEAAKAFLDATK